MTIERVPAATGGSYSDVVAVGGPGRWVHVSGQVGFGPDGATVSGSVYEQSNGCFDHIERCLEKVGGSLADVVRITTFLTDLEDYAGFARARAERFDAPPASAAVQVAGLLVGASVEIDAVAFIPD